MENVIDSILKQTDIAGWRFEQKSQIQELREFDIIDLLNRHPVCFNEVFYERRVNNIYLDTFDYQYYYDNFSSIANRVKFRIRWYADNIEDIKEPYLEIKIKRGELGYKIRKRFCDFALNDFFLRDKYIKFVNDSDLPLVLKEFLRSLKPSLLNSYKRRYFSSFDNNYRSTVDYNLSYFMPNRNFLNFINNNDVIFELKYASNHDQSGKIFNFLPFRRTRYSKYIMGMEQVIS